MPDRRGEDRIGEEKRRQERGRGEDRIRQRRAWQIWRGT
jgi:hypothetical protein